MSLRPRDLLSWQGRVGREVYLAVGVIAFLIKRVLDLLIAAHFHVRLGPLGYWAPLGRGARITDLWGSGAEAEYVAAMLLAALPFIWIGLTLTVRRLRDAGQPVWLVALFFVPVVNLLFFAVLSILPSAWRPVVAFSEIPPPHELLFRAGIAYPLRTEISGHGPGAVRRCVFSTGAFVEPIEVWDEPHLLRFGVTVNPPPLEELTPYGHIDTPHLHGFLVSEQGQFLLTPLPGGRTRLEGTTRYRHSLWPAAYWRLWSDSIIHRIHPRVLEHIRREVEG